MQEAGSRKWVVSLQAVQGGETRRVDFDWAGVPTLEQAAGAAMTQLEKAPQVITPVPNGSVSPNQTALKGRGFEIVRLEEG